MELANRELSISEMAHSMRAYAQQHAATLRHYDRLGEQAPSSPQSMVIAEDLGRMNVFAARLSATGAADLLEHRPKPDMWSALPQNLDLAAAPEQPSDVWAASPDCRAALALFDHFRRGPRSGDRMAWASKLLHLKWPRFFPIVDAQVRDKYRGKALSMMKQFELGSGRSRPTVLAYWAAIRSDLVADGAIDELAHAAAVAADGADESDPANALRNLSPVRLADILVWES